MNIKSLCLCAFFLATLSACGTRGVPVDSVDTVLDEREIIQSPQYFADKLPFGERLLLDEQEKAEQVAYFKKRFLAAWKQTKPYKGNLPFFASYVKVSEEKRGFSENLHRWANKHYQALAYNAQYEYAPSMAKNALVVKDTALRLAPTDKPYFINPKKPGQAYPFDMFRNSTVRNGSAVKVFHSSYDGLWYYVEGANASGWVQAEHIAFTSEDIENKWKNAEKYVAILHDNTIIKNETIRQAVNLGSVYPLIKESAYGYTIAIAVRMYDGKALVQECYVPKQHASIIPIPYTADSVAMLAEPLMGNLYGWGGMYNNRDCSSTLQDLFTPYGVWLPRNSAQQARSGQRILLNDMSDEEKEKAILTHGIAFQTLIYLPGHIGLYVGQHNGKAVMLHNMWGVRIGEFGRFVVGKTVITTLYPGQELEGFGSSLMSRVQSITIIGKK